MRLPAALLPALLAAIPAAVPTGPAAAQDCPTAADLETGIRLSRTAPPLTRIVRLYEGDIRVMSFGSGGDGKLVEQFAHPLAVAARLSEDMRLQFAYDSPPDALARLDETGLWTSTLTIHSSEGPPSRQQMRVEFLGHETAEIGQCSYPVWHTRTVLTLGPGRGVIYEELYAPSLSAVLGISFLDGQGQTLQTVAYDSVEAQ